MNRTILIVLCDFLLLSLLAFSSPDITKFAEEGAPPKIKLDMATNQVESGRDLAAVMKMALEDEQKRRELLLNELASTRETASEREKQLQSVQQRLQSTQAQQANLEEQYAAARTHQANLQAQFTAAQTNIEQLNRRVRVSSAAASMSKEKLAEMEAELRKRAEEAATLQQQIAQLKSTNQAVLGEKQRLATQLAVAQVEQRHATEQVVAMKEQVKVEREEKAKLAEGVKALATNSTQLVREIRENRSLSPNTIFQEFVAHRVHADFHAVRSGLFDTNKRKEAGTVLVSDGTNTFALCHVDETPLSLWIPGTQWEGLTGALSCGNAQVPIHSLSFHFQDPRVVFMPVSSSEAQRLGGKVYHLSKTPFKFQDAVLIGASEGYYGECRFEMDLNTPAYLKLDRSMLKGLFGKFNPSRGDLVFSQTGELLGIMANNTYCLLIRNFEPIATFKFGEDVRAQNTGSTLAALYSVVQRMPFRLQ